MKTDWFKDVNPGLEKLAGFLGTGKPSHGYTIAEKAPEVVTAPGIYFPAKRGEVIPLESREKGGKVSPPKDNDTRKMDILESIVSMMKPMHLESRALGGIVVPPEPMKLEQSKYDILKAALSILKPQAQTGAGKSSYNERVSKYGSPSGKSMFAKPEGPDLYDRLKAARGSPGMTPSTSSTPSLPTVPSAPVGMANLPTTGSYSMKPDTMKSEDILDLSKNDEGAWENTLLKPMADGGVVKPSEDEDELERLRKRYLEMNKPNDYRFNIPGIPAPAYPGETPESLELAARERWEKPGYPEKRLAEAQKISPNVVAVQPGFQRSYYEAHPEERLMDYVAAENKPTVDMYKGLIEDEKTRQQGYGRGFGPTPRERRRGAKEPEYGKNIPELTKGLEKAMALPQETLEATMKGRKTATAPHLVQTSTGEYVWATPGGVLPAGIKGKTSQTPLPGFEEWKKTSGNEGKTYEDFRKWETGLKEKETATSGLREFEIATGIDPSTRGTSDYSKSYMEFLGGKKTATRDPIEQKKLGTTLRKEFNALQPVKDYRDIENRFNIMGKAIEEAKTTKNFVAVDQALITIFNKMTDPQSVVRESEYLRTPQDLAIWNKIKGKVSKVVAGGAGLSSDDRNALFSMAKQFQNVYESKFNQLRNEYRGYAVDYSLDPETVIKGGGGEKIIVKQFVSPSTGKTKYVYSDGTEEIK